MFECSLEFLTQQLFVIMFLAYSDGIPFFIASGIPAVEPLPGFNHVMMPILAAYYLPE